jgi:hypothetical protein
MAKNQVALANAGQLVQEHGDALKQLGITPHSFNTMAVVKRTNQLKKEKELLEKELEGLNKEAEVLTEKINKSLEQQEQDHKNKVSKLYLKFAKEAKIIAPKVNVNAETKLQEKCKRQLVLKTEFYTQRTSHANSSYGSLTTHISKPMPKPINDLYKKREGIHEQMGKVHVEIQDVRCSLQDIGELERSANAQTTHRILSQTDDGQALLKQLGLEDLE